MTTSKHRHGSIRETENTAALGLGIFCVTNDEFLGDHPYIIVPHVHTNYNSFYHRHLFCKVSTSFFKSQFLYVF